MIILDEPYVSDFLKSRILAHRFPVLDTVLARRVLGDNGDLLSSAEFAARVRDGRAPRLYANSENAIAWVNENLAFSGLPEQVRRFKDKEAFRELLRPLFPDYRFEAVDLAEIEGFDPARFPKPFIVKPTVGFFSLGVHKVERDEQWPGVVARIKEEVDAIRRLYPAQVLDTKRFLIEESISGEEYAVDVYWGEGGEPVLLNVLHHVFPDENNLADRVYVTSPEIVRAHGARFTALMAELGKLAELRNFPAHVELRLAPDGSVGFIEANPLRFTGWCLTDVAWHAWGIDPYAAYLNGETPDWDALCAEHEGRMTSFIIGDVPPDVDPSTVVDVDYASFLERFSEPLEMRRIDWRRSSVFAFVFARHEVGDMAELDAVLRSDLREYLRFI